jgi:lipopolysaccharide/colanic/teichoic acid biosynthesis glycosyltransferase
MEETFYRRSGKRSFDLAFSALGIVLASPLLLLTAVLVKITSSGPVIYRHRRVGLNGLAFDVLKFRTMVRDAEKSGPAITSATDARITPAGRWLRRSKLDELPQLWNVLKGEMSFVGPRPEVPRYVESYSPRQRRVLSIRPGLTDPASIAYRHEEELLAGRDDLDRYYREVVLPDKLNLNLGYLDRVSLFYDLSLLLRTTSAIFTSHPQVLRQDR